MASDPVTINDLSSSPYGFRKSSYRRKSLSELDPKLGNDIQYLLKSADVNQVNINKTVNTTTRMELPILDKISNDNSQKTTEQRKKNIDEAIVWIRNELCSLKEQDKSLMRQFLDLRTSINQFKDDIDPFDDLSNCSPRRSMSMLDHLNEEKRKSRFALARRLIEDINTLEELGQSDSDDDDDLEEDSPASTTGTPKSNVVQDSFLVRGRPITHSVSVAATAARPPSVVERVGNLSPVSKGAHSVSQRHGSESDKITKSYTDGVPRKQVESRERKETEDTKL